MNQSNADKLRALGIPVPMSKTSGQIKVRCPRCAQDAKHKNKTDLSVDLDNGQWRCHNTPECNYKGYVNKIVLPEKVYTRPVERTNVTPLRQDIVDSFAARRISQQTLLHFRIMDGPEWMRANKHWPYDGIVHTLQIPYYENGELINIKYRSSMKQFGFVKGAKLIFYNIDAIKGYDWCIIVEGEPDTWTVHEHAYPNVVSVPNGASASDNSRLEFLDNNWEYFEGMKKIVIAVDDDIPGRALKAELIRRFGAERCFFVTYGEGCKDINEHAIKFGPLTVKGVIDNSKPCPIKGIKTAEDLTEAVLDYFHNGLPQGVKIGIIDTDTNEELISFLPAQLCVRTGMPNHGKSDLTDQDLVMLAIIYDWRFALFSPENFPLALYVAKLIEKITGKSFANTNNSQYTLTVDDIKRALLFIQDHFYFIAEEDIDSFSLDDVLAHAEILVRKYGINGVLIDPWNALEHSDDNVNNETKYINKCLKKIIMFNRRHDVITWLIAHPEKMKKAANKIEYPVPTLYNISGSANWANRCDIGECAYRNYKDGTTTRIVQKVKQKHQGKVGTVKYRYNVLNGRFHPANGEADNRNWLDHKPTGYATPALNFDQTESTEIYTGDSNEPNPLD